MPKRKRPRPQPLPAPRMLDGDDDIDGGSDQQEPEAGTSSSDSTSEASKTSSRRPGSKKRLPAAPDSPSSPSGSESSTSSESSSSSPDSVPADAEANVDQSSSDGGGNYAFYPDTIEGHKLRLHSVDNRVVGFRVTCRHHRNCKCYRALSMDTSIFGPLAPVYFIGAWARRGEEPQGHDNGWRPSRDDV